MAKFIAFWSFEIAKNGSDTPLRHKNESQRGPRAGPLALSTFLLLSIGFQASLVLHLLTSEIMLIPASELWEQVMKITLDNGVVGADAL